MQKGCGFCITHFIRLGLAFNCSTTRLLNENKSYIRLYVSISCIL